MHEKSLARESVRPEGDSMPLHLLWIERREINNMEDVVGLLSQFDTETIDGT